jgi:hypothetical protein
MANGIYTPLQINTAAGLCNNQGIKNLPTALTAAIAAFDATTTVSAWLTAVNSYQSQSYKTASTLELLLSIGTSTIPALGNSIPTAPLGNFPLLNQEYLPSQSDDSTLDPYGLADLVKQTGEAYLGIYNNTTDLGRFCQGFMAVQGYINSINAFINSAVNAATYLGPTFTTMSDLVSNNITSVVDSQQSGAVSNLAIDIANQGLLVDTDNFDAYGTPAALLSQISKVTGAVGKTLPTVQNALYEQDLSAGDIVNLTNNNIASLLNPNGLTPNEFDKLQKKAYTALTKITGSDLQEVLDILEVTTPNVNTMADLLNPAVVFPNSYTALVTPTPNGPMPVYQPNGSVDMNLSETVGIFLPTPSGCDQLAKIIPPDQAVANKAIQAAFQQIANLPETTWPDLAQTMQSFTRDPWQVDKDYLPNSVVASAPVNPNSALTTPLAILSPDTVFYKAIQDVTSGINITDTDYWLPIVLDGLNTMSELNQIEALTNPVAAATTAIVDNQIATGSGPNGTITTCDVLGTAIDYNNLAAEFATATAAIQSLQSAGALASINTAYNNISVALNDATVLSEIANANNAIAVLSVNPTYAATVATLNTAWVNIATYLNQEKTYQVRAGVDYFALLANEQNSILAFSQQLSQYGQQTQDCGPYDFLQTIADTTTLTGQALVGSLREGENQMILSATRLAVPDIKPSAESPLIPQRTVPVVN